MSVYSPEVDLIQVQDSEMIIANSLANYQIMIPIINTKITDEKTFFKVLLTIEIYL